MFEVECPDCRHTFDVGDDEQTTRCPACGLELDLVEPGDTSGAPEAEAVGDIPQEEGPSGEGPFEEVPCPHCEGPLLLAPGDESGLCAHCERPLLFENQRALPFSQPSGAKAGAPTTPEVPATRAPPVSGFFDPNLEVTPQNAPLVECAPALNEPPADPEPARSSVSTAQTAVKKGKSASKRSRTGKKSTKKKSAPAKKGGGSRKSKKAKKRGKTTAKKSRGGRK